MILVLDLIYGCINLGLVKLRTFVFFFISGQISAGFLNFRVYVVVIRVVKFVGLL